MLIKNIMKLFCRTFGQKINLEKSYMFFSKNVGVPQWNQLSAEIGIYGTKDLGNYLGILIFSNRASRGTYNFIMIKFTSD